MDIALYLVGVFILCSYCTPICGLLKVQAIKSSYTAEYGGEVTMECHFTVKSSTDFKDMTVIWRHITDKAISSEVAKYSNGKVIELSQDQDNKDRVKLLPDGLPKGHSILKISNVKMTDEGQYVCIIDAQGSDFKIIHLAVQAPYKQLNTKVTDVVASSGQTMKELSCQSVGYPKPEVTWLSSSGNISAIDNVSYILTAERLFNITSVIRISSVANTTFTCIFWNKELENSISHNFTFLGMDSNGRQHDWIYAAVIIILIIVSVPVLAFIYGHRKGRCKKTVTEYNSIKPDQTRSIDNSASTTSKYSDYNSEHAVIAVENT